MCHTAAMETRKVCHGERHESYLNDRSRTPGATAEIKTNKYSSLTKSYLFVPIAAETVGAINKDGMDFSSDLGKRMTQSTDDHRESVILLHRLSVLI